MLRRKIAEKIKAHLLSKSNKMLIVDGARQIGKSFIIRQVGQELFPNYIEVNMEEDKRGDRLFAEVGTVNDFLLALSAIAGDKMQGRDNTLVFIDEIQAYPQLLTLVKFLMADNRFTYIASGSLLGVTLRKTQSIPGGSIERLHMYPLDFEEFLWANGVGEMAVEAMRKSFLERKSLPETLHKKVLDLFKKYLLVGGLPDCVNIFINEMNIAKVRKAQEDIRELYRDDASKYEKESQRTLKIQRIYDLVPSNLENKKKRVVVKDIEGKRGKRMDDYQDEFDYLISSGVALDVKAISQPVFPLVQNAGKNLLKLYLNDVGIFTGLLYHNNIKAVLDDVPTVNLGSVYENVVAQELRAHGNSLFYYDNKQHGEVDFLVDDYNKLSVLPLEVKSGKDYKVHSALDHFMHVPGYNVAEAFVLSNEREVSTEHGVTYLPVYYVMFIEEEQKGQS